MVFSFVTEGPALNQALFQVTHGLYVITAKRGDKINGQVVDSLMQVTSAPPRIAVGNRQTVADARDDRSKRGISS